MVRRLGRARRLAALQEADLRRLRRLLQKARAHPGRSAGFNARLCLPVGPLFAAEQDLEGASPPDQGGEPAAGATTRDGGEAGFHLAQYRPFQAGEANVGGQGELAVVISRAPAGGTGAADDPAARPRWRRFGGCSPDLPATLTG